MTKTPKSWLQGIHLSASSPGRSRRRVVITLVIGLVGFALTWASFRIVQNRNESNYRFEFEQESRQIASDLETSFNLSLEHLRSISAFFAASESVSREEFQTFVSPAHLRNASVCYSTFLPRVESELRESFETQARAEGLEEFAIRGANADGEPIPLVDFEDYFPIYFVEPPLPEVLGIDTGSQPGRARYLRLATKTDVPVVTSPVSLNGDPPDTLSVLAFHAVRFAGTGAADQCDGVAVVIHRIRPLVESVVGKQRLDELQVVVTDPSDDAPFQLVYKNFPGSVESIKSDGRPLQTHEMSFANQTWTLKLSPAMGSPFAPPRPPWWILGTGCVLSMLLACVSSAMVTIMGLRKQVKHALQLGQYRLGSKLGEGGMGSVFEASHEMLARPAAIKLIRADSSESTHRWQSRFEREAQATAGLQSPHTVSIYDFGKTDEGTFYYVMERLDGMDLASLVAEEGPLPPARAVHLLRQVCHSLAEAHASGLMHRDIKPANIFVCKHALEDDFVKVLDFGLVKAFHREPSVDLTQAGTLLGTPAYMAPEMIQDQAVDARSDLYSLGCVAYFMLTGKPVFDGSISAVIAGHVSQQPPSVSVHSLGDISADLEQVIGCCLSKNPDDRPASAIELEQQLASCQISDWDRDDVRAPWSGRQARSPGSDACVDSVQTISMDSTQSSDGHPDRTK